jgi:hypothetical protein
MFNGSGNKPSTELPYSPTGGWDVLNKNPNPHTPGKKIPH